MARSGGFREVVVGGSRLQVGDDGWWVELGKGWLRVTVGAMVVGGEGGGLEGWERPLKGDGLLVTGK